MALRLTNTSKWSSEWFLSLSCEHQNLFQYMWDMCDASGVWPISPTAARNATHAAFSIKSILEAYNGIDLAADGDAAQEQHVKLLEGGRHLWLVYFVITQNPNGLDSSRQPRHKPVIDGLKHWGLLDEVRKQYEIIRIANPITEKQQELKTITGELKAAVDKSFDVFWTAHPRKVGKRNAEKAWAKHVGALHAELLPKILAAVEQQSKSRQWQETRFIPHPATWLNGHRWKDDAEGSGKKSDDRHAGGF